MFGWLFKKRDEKLEEETKKGFTAVKNDMNSVGKWIKHLDSKNKQLFDAVKELKLEISSIKEDVENLRENIEQPVELEKTKQLFKKMAVLNKQTTVDVVEDDVQTAVQTGNFYDNLKGLSSNERMLIFTLANNDLRLSYEDLALLLGKERATIRGQINSIKQKSEGLINEIIEKNGKKRVFVPDEIKQNLMKYAKVRVSKGKKKQN